MHDWDKPYPLVSVVITSYNYGMYIAAAIDSVIEQDYPNFELLILENASTDNTPQVIERYRNDPRVRYERNEQNIGIIPNHNKGIALAQGDYIVFLSADDAFLPGHLSRAVEYYRTHPHVDILYMPYIAMDGEGRHYLPFHHPGIPRVDQFDSRNEFVDLFMSDNYMCLPTMLIHRTIFERLGGFSEAFPVAADFDLCLRFITAGLRFGFLDVFSIAMRTHAFNRSRSAYVESGDQVREHVALLDRFVTAENLWRVHGRENDVIRMYPAKLSNLAGNSAKMSSVESEVKSSVDRVMALLRQSAASPRIQRTGLPRVSVILPTTGNTAFLESALRSLREQTYSDFEVVIVQDGGPSVEAFVRTFGPRDRYRFARRELREGPFAARNAGLQLAVGEIVAFLDEDNILGPQHLELLVGGLDTTGARVAYSRGRVVLENVDSNSSGAREVVATADDIFGVPGAWPVAVAPSIPLDCIAHYRSCNTVIGTFSELPVHEDWEYLVRLSKAFPQAASIDAVTVELRQRGAFAGQRLRTQWASYRTIIDGLHAHYNAQAVPELVRAREAYRNRLATVQLDTDAATVPGMFALLRVLGGIS